MKKLADIDTKMELISEDRIPDAPPPTRREILRLVGNVRAETADDARRVRRIITRLRDKTLTDLILENDDMAFLEKAFEKNAMGLTGWMQGQILEVLGDADRVDAKPQVV